MTTERIYPDNVTEAARILTDGGLCAIPTETVYGLAANALDPAAVRKIFAAKGRPQDNPLIAHIADLDMLPVLAREVPPAATRLAEAFWPGPLTVILPKSPGVPGEVTAGLDTVAVRMPAHPVAREIIRLCRLPLAAPSANLSGKPSPTTPEEVAADLDGRIDGIVWGGRCRVGVESTVISLAGEIPTILRPGAVTREMLEAVLGEVALDKAVLSRPDPGERVASPGMKYRHYAPRCRVVMVEGERDRYVAYVNARAGEGVYALCFAEAAADLAVPAVVYGEERDQASQANGLFSALRELDERGCALCYAEAPEKSGVGLAVYNRLVRACGFNVVKA